MSLPNPSMDFTPFDTLTAADLDDVVENVESLAAGTGLDNNAVAAAKLATNAITLGYTQITSTFSTSSATFTQITGLTSTVTVPAGGRRIKITAYIPYIDSSSITSVGVSLWDGTVGSGTQLNLTYGTIAGASYRVPGTVIATVTPAAGSKTYNVGILSSAANLVFAQCGATSPAYILVEAI